MTTTAVTDRIIPDCDPGNGVPATDIDDGLALGLLLAAPRTRVEAVTIVTGNTHRDVGYKLARTMLDDIGTDIPVYAGAADALMQQHGKVEYVEAPSVSAVDTAGAGDTFCGAFAAALADSAGVPDAVRFAVHAAALSVTQTGAQAAIPP